MTPTSHKAKQAPRGSCKVGECRATSWPRRDPQHWRGTSPGSPRRRPSLGRPAGEGASPLPSDCWCTPTRAQPDRLSTTWGTQAVADFPQALGEAIKAKDHVSPCGTLGDTLPCHSFPGTVRVQTPPFRQTPCGPRPEACPHGSQGSLPTRPQRHAALGEQGGQPRPTAAGLQSPSQGTRCHPNPSAGRTAWGVQVTVQKCHSGGPPPCPHVLQ